MLEANYMQILVIQYHPYYTYRILKQQRELMLKIIVCQSEPLTSDINDPPSHALP